MCRHETDSYVHYEQCEKDREEIAAAAQWIKRMEIEDQAIIEYHRLQDECTLNLPPIDVFISECIERYG